MNDTWCRPLSVDWSLLRGPPCEAVDQDRLNSTYENDRHVAALAEAETEKQATRTRFKTESVDGELTLIGIKGGIDTALDVMCGLEGSIAQGYKTATNQGLITEREAYDRAFEHFARVGAHAHDAHDSEEDGDEEGKEYDD